MVAYLHPILDIRRHSEDKRQFLAIQMHKILDIVVVLQIHTTIIATLLNLGSFYLKA